MSRTLLLVGAPAGGSRSDLFREKYIIGKIDEKKVSEDLVNTTQARGIVSVLIATVTFASAFTLPGGYYQSANDGGVPGTLVGARVSHLRELQRGRRRGRREGEGGG